MLRATVLTALTRLGDGSARDTNAALAGTEPILRPFAKKKILRAQVDAQVATRLDDEAHVARLAALTWARVPVLDADDEGAVRAEFERLPKLPTARRPVLTIAVLTLLVTGPLVAIALYFQLRAFDPRRSALGTALGTSLASYESTLSRGGDVTEARNAVLSGAKGALGDPGTKSLTTVLDAAEAFMAGVADEPSFAETTRPLNAALLEKGLPFVVDPRVISGKFPIVYTFYVEREDKGRIEGLKDERVVYLWRLDDLNISKAALGYTNRYADAALVLLDQIETELVDRVLPSLAEGARPKLFDDESREEGETWEDNAEADAARATRESFAQFADAKELAHLGALLEQRAAIVKGWKRDLRGLNLELRPPERLIPEADYTKDLWIRVSMESRAEWNTLHDDLTSRTTLATFERLRDRFAETTARHELQHRVDTQRTPNCKGGSPCPEHVVPARVRAIFGPPDGEAVVLGTLPSRIADELGAYLAEMSDGALSPRMTVVDLSRLLYNRHLWGDEYSNTAVILIEAVAVELGIAEEGQSLARGVVRRQRLADWLHKIYEKNDDELRAAARGAYVKLFGVDLPKVTIELVKRNPSWRH